MQLCAEKLLFRVLNYALTLLTRVQTRQSMILKQFWTQKRAADCFAINCSCILVKSYNTNLWSALFTVKSVNFTTKVFL